MFEWTSTPMITTTRHRGMTRPGTHASTPPHDNVIGWIRVLAEEAPI
jgi:hypothetical protein